MKSLAIKEQRHEDNLEEIVQQEAKKFFYRLINDLQFGITIRDGQGKALFCNKIALKFSGLSEKDFLETTLPAKSLLLIKEDGAELPGEDHPTSIAIKTKKTVKDIVLGVRYEKDYKWALISAEPIVNSDGEIEQVITTFIDITKRKKLEEKLLNTEINKQKIITKATIEGQEKERKQIGKELHDNINQLLTTTLLYLDIAKDTDNSKSQLLIELSSKVINTAMNEIKKFSRTLAPPSLGDITLVEAIKDLCVSIKTTQVFSIRFFQKDFDETVLDEDLKLILFRIIQEQVKNIIMHSGATSALIRLSTTNGRAMLLVCDNGKGFDLFNKKRGLGLNNIINRAELFNGKAEIRSAPGRGCSIVVTIPFE